MTQISRYLQITPWLLLEYVYSEEAIDISKAPLWKTRNDYLNRSGFLNGNISREVTSNVLERSVIPVNKNLTKWGSMSPNSVVPLYTIAGSQTTGLDPNIHIDKSIQINGTVQYDTIKLHLVAGFNIDDIAGIITNIKINTWNGNDFDLINHLWRRGDEWITFNPNPLWLGDKLYDRWIEFQVPALSWLKTLSIQSTESFLTEYIDDPRGIRADGLIKVSIFEIDEIETENDINYYTTGNRYNVSFLSEDQFANLRAVIRENENSDYFEYFGAWGDDIIQDYISKLNETGTWALSHNIRVIEQVGTTMKTTTNMTTLQDRDFGLPNIFRPVIINADIAFSFSIDYTMRLINADNGEQVIRTASVTSNEPKKYGQKLKKIGVNEGYKPVKVYNKIINNTNDTLFNIQTQNTEITNQVVRTSPINEIRYRTEVVPVYFNNYDISIKANNNTFDIEYADIVLGQGNAIILISPFDNHLSFNIFDKKNGEWEEVEIDHNKLYLSFVLDDGSKEWIKPEPENQDKNGITFVVNSELSTKILKQQNRAFYIISKDSGDKVESILYTGKYAPSSEREKIQAQLEKEKTSQVDKKIEKLKKLEEEIKNREKKLLEEQKKLQSTAKNIESSEAITANRTTTSQNNNRNMSRAASEESDREMREESAGNKNSKRLLERNTQRVRENINSVKDIRDIKFAIKDLPGESIDFSYNIKNIKPVIKSKKKEQPRKYEDRER